MSEDTDDTDESMSEVERERHLKLVRRTFVTPKCCQKMQETAAICLKVNNKFWKGDLEKTPEWVVRVVSEFSMSSFGCEKAAFCPFCAAPVPEIEKTESKRKVMIVTDGGYYCDVCKQRCNCCTCLPAEFHWQPVVKKRRTRPVEHPPQ